MRSYNDSWDITTSVGSTALFVAAARALEARRSDPLVVDSYAAVFCRAAGGRWAAVVDGEDTGSKLTTTDFGTHFVAFQAARTRYFDDYFLRAATAGVRQVVMLAAGLDSRSYRLPWPDGTVVYELDQPRVLDFKREVLDDLGATPNARRVEVAVDLRDDWTSALQDTGFDRSAPAAFIAEGLLIYLPATAQGDLFRGIDALAAPGSYAAIEEGDPMPTAAYEAAKSAEEADVDGDGTFFQLIYNQQFAKAADWFGSHGWMAEATPLADQISGLGRPLPEPGSQPDVMIRSNTLVSAIKR
ncbi:MULTISPECIES: SAM-dependent methyltransferase [unclassified Mycolicibacterium]|uniref:SAM-dependent methyltransferase n=1 Tax=unclassified Mycolicibacterium TaxID=2636767 RepID=UPI0012DF9E07|nr:MULTISPECIES: SAM-dependent methyltransferase [unclassified Mycolicibacterium]MUL85375.1 SAM-dependent methyltransferase [Mycolicibacterium sp. CBMA 329]MUL88861.1 SAM-dependent methyltransferase [Mycolicibacterium sp. CBMA 331]MUM01865.1 SAM-dependent methyltransferase [Mycolicibacterium sp. CBMA 334]MUM29199.1 SAM-dependent methyltransferase [Mycolicibacterium sp. CBMA 295]MUM40508.1 SAM-dependent methyltransferase [Mycolicibacterium sp. CBMA 247]